MLKLATKVRYAAALGVFLWTGVALGMAAERTVLLEHFSTVG